MDKKLYFQNRLKRLKTKIYQAGWAGLIVTKPENIFYLSGFTGSSSILLITEKRNYLLIDFRYYEQASQQIHKGIGIKKCKLNLLRECANLIKDLKAGTIGIEFEYLNLKQFKFLKKFSRDTKYKDDKNIVESLRIVKDEYEISVIKKACEITCACAKFIKRKAKSDFTEKQLCTEAKYFMMRHGAQSAAFEPIIVTEPRSSMPHAVCTNHRIKKNNTLMVDIGTYFNMYNSDLTRNFVLSRIHKNIQKIYKIVAEAQHKAIQLIKPGVKISDIDLIARNYIKDKGFGEFFGHALGHGVGLQIHEAPRIFHTNKERISEGMVFTVEPGIYIPGKYGVRLEETVLVTKDGYEILTNKRHR